MVEFLEMRGEFTDGMDVVPSLFLRAIFYQTQTLNLLQRNDVLSTPETRTKQILSRSMMRWTSDLEILLINILIIFY